MDIRKLQRAIIDGLEDVKAQNIAVFNTEHLSSMFERVIVASGTSNRQTKALAASVRDAVRELGYPILSTEGEDNGEWIIVDCGAAVVHVMQPGIREYYHLEEIWGDKPVKLKLAAGGTKLVKASEGGDDEAPAKKPAKKAAKAAPGTTVSAAKPVAAKRGGSRAEAAEKPVAKPARKAAAAKPVAAVKKAVGSTVAAKKAAAKKPTVKAQAQAAAKAAATAAALPAWAASGPFSGWVARIVWSAVLASLTQASTAKPALRLTACENGALIQSRLPSSTRPRRLRDSSLTLTASPPAQSRSTVKLSSSCLSTGYSPL